MPLQSLRAILTWVYAEESVDSLVSYDESRSDDYGLIREYVVTIVEEASVGIESILKMSQA